MIIDNKARRVDVLGVPDALVDAPPAYDDIAFQPQQSHSISPSTPTNTNSFNGRLFSPSRRNKPLPVVNDRAEQKLHRPTAPKPKRGKLSQPVPLSPKVQSDTRETVRGIVCDIVQGSSTVRSTTSNAISVLQSCAAACSSHSISFARIIQERSIEDHAPLYWAIVSRPPGSVASSKSIDRGDDAFLLELIAHAAPLTPSAVSELRSACLVVSNNALFQRLRSVPGVLPLSGTDGMLLSSTSTGTQDGPVSGKTDPEKSSTKAKPKPSPGFRDVAITNEIVTDLNVDSFSVSLHLKMFQQRMKVSGLLEVEFIARGRLWQLIFFVMPPPSPSPKGSATPDTPSENAIPSIALRAARARKLPPGTWALVLALLEGSSQCYADARLVVSVSSNGADCPPHPGHPRYATLPATGNTDPRPPLPPRHNSANSASEVKTKRSFFRRTTSEDKNKPGSRLPIILNLNSSSSNPLIAQPTPPWNTTSPLPEDLDDLLSPNASNPKRRRLTRAEKRAARKRAAKERRLREGCETRRDKKERARLADTVMLASFGDISSNVGKAGRTKGQGARAEELLDDGCPYIAPDGALHALFEVRLSTSPLDSDGSGCVIC